MNISSPIKRKKNKKTKYKQKCVDDDDDDDDDDDGHKSAEHFPKATLGNFLQLTAFLSQI